MKRNFIHFPATAGILTLSLLCTGSISNTSKAMSVPAITTSATQNADDTKDHTTGPKPASTAPATGSAISTPEPTDLETPNPNEIKIADILSLSKSKLLAKPGNTYYLTYNASSAPDVHSSNKKTAVATLQQQKLKITIPASAVRGSTASVTLTLGSHKKVLTVTVENKVKKVSYAKKKLTLQKGKSKKITIPFKAENTKKKTTDLIRVTSSKKSVAAIKGCKITTGKITFSIQCKQQGITKVQIKAGNVKKTFSCTVKEKKSQKKSKKNA